MTQGSGRWWSRWVPGRRPAGALQTAVEDLAREVRSLGEMQRKQASQLKKIRESQLEMDARWQSTLERFQKAATDAQVRQGRDAARVHDKAAARWQALVRESQQYRGIEQKWRVLFARQIDAIIRRLYLAPSDLPPPFDIAASRFRLRSQNEEDGVILALLRHAGTTGRRFVEIGCGRTGGNAAMLAYECGWSGLMVDIGEESVARVRERFAFNPGVVAVRAEVTAANVNGLLQAHGFTGEVDLLSIDIDSYDYWVFEALTACSPRLLVLEYNSAFGPERAVTIPADQPLQDAPKAYRGASLAALEKLARRKGYRLVACENAGVNAFFLRDGVAPDVPGVSASRAFRPSLDRREVAEVPRGGDFFDRPADARFPLIEV